MEIWSRSSDHCGAGVVPIIYSKMNVQNPWAFIGEPC